MSINSFVRRLPRDHLFSVKMEMSERSYLVSLVCQRLKDESLSLILYIPVSPRKDDLFNISVEPSRACDCFIALTTAFIVLQELGTSHRARCIEKYADERFCFKSDRWVC
jgi:hypothetical protein